MDYVIWTRHETTLWWSSAERSLNSARTFLDRWIFSVNFYFNVLFCPSRWLKQAIIRLVEAVFWTRWYRPRSILNFERWVVLVLVSRWFWEHIICNMVARRHKCAQRTPALLIALDFHIFSLFCLLFIFSVSHLLFDFLTHLLDL